MQDDLIYMKAALEEAKKAQDRGEVPIGAVAVHAPSGKIVAANGNRTLEHCDPSAHAEMLVIRDVCQIESAQRIPDYDLYVTLEPCAMCAAAISFARIRRLVFGALDEKGGGVLHGGKFYQQPTCHHRPEIARGALADESGLILKEFFKARR